MSLKAILETIERINANNRRALVEIATARIAELKALREPVPEPTIDLLEAILEGIDEDPMDRAAAIADLLLGLYGEEALLMLGEDEDEAEDEGQLIESLLEAWDPDNHPRGKGGRFIKKNSPEAVDTAKEAIKQSLKKPKSADTFQELMGHLNILTVKQIRDLSKNYSVSAGGKVKAELVEKIAKRLDAGRREVDTPEGDYPSYGEWAAGEREKRKKEPKEKPTTDEQPSSVGEGSSGEEGNTNGEKESEEFGNLQKKISDLNSQDLGMWPHDQAIKPYVESAKSQGLVVSPKNLPDKELDAIAESLGGIKPYKLKYEYVFPTADSASKFQEAINNAESAEQQKQEQQKQERQAAKQAESEKHQEKARSLGFTPDGPKTDRQSAIGFMSKKDALDKSVQWETGKVIEVNGVPHVITSSERPQYASRDDVASGDRPGPAGWSINFSAVPIKQPNPQDTPQEGERNSEGLIFRDGRWRQDEGQTPDVSGNGDKQKIKTAMNTIAETEKLHRELGGSPLQRTLDKIIERSKSSKGTDKERIVSLARDLVNAWQDNHSERDFFEEVLKNMGAEQISSPNKVEKFNASRHLASTPTDPGTMVRIVEPGWVYPSEGSPVRLARASVSLMTPYELANLQDEDQTGDVKTPPKSVDDAISQGITTNMDRDMKIDLLSKLSGRMDRQTRAVSQSLDESVANRDVPNREQVESDLAEIAKANDGSFSVPFHEAYEKIKATHPELTKEQFQSALFTAGEKGIIKLIAYTQPLHRLGDSYGDKRDEFTELAFPAGQQVQAYFRLGDKPSKPQATPDVSDSQGKPDIRDLLQRSADTFDGGPENGLIDLSAAEKFGELVRQHDSGEKIPPKELLDQVHKLGRGQYPDDATHAAANDLYGEMLGTMTDEDVLQERETSSLPNYSAVRSTMENGKRGLMTGGTYPDHLEQSVPAYAQFLREKLGAKPESAKNSPQQDLTTSTTDATIDNSGETQSVPGDKAMNQPISSISGKPITGKFNVGIWKENGEADFQGGGDSLDSFEDVLQTVRERNPGKEVFVINKGQESEDIIAEEKRRKAALSSAKAPTPKAIPEGAKKVTHGDTTLHLSPRKNHKNSVDVFSDDGKNLGFVTKVGSYGRGYNDRSVWKVNGTGFGHASRKEALSALLSEGKG